MPCCSPLGADTEIVEPEPAPLVSSSTAAPIIPDLDLNGCEHVHSGRAAASQTRAPSNADSSVDPSAAAAHLEGARPELMPSPPPEVDPLAESPASSSGTDTNIVALKSEPKHEGATATSAAAEANVDCDRPYSAADGGSTAEACSVDEDKEGKGIVAADATAEGAADPLPGCADVKSPQSEISSGGKGHFPKEIPPLEEAPETEAAAARELKRVRPLADCGDVPADRERKRACA